MPRRRAPFPPPGALEAHRRLSVAVAPNGREVAAISRISRVGAKAWEVDSGRSLKLPLVRGNTTAIAYSPDMRLLAAAVTDDPLDDRRGGVDVFDLSTGEPLPLLDGGDEVYDLAFSPDGSVLVAAVASGVIGWEIDRGRPVEVLRLREKADLVSFISARELIVGSGGGAELRRVSIEDGRVQESWAGKGASAAAVSPDGRLVASGDVAAVRILDLWEGGPPQVVPVEGVVASLDWGPDGRVLAAGMSDGRVVLFSVRGVRPLDTQGATRLSGPEVRVETSVGPSIDMGRQDGPGDPFRRKPPTSSRDDRGYDRGYDEGALATPPPEEKAEIVADVTILVLNSFDRDPRSSSKLERSLRDKIKKLEPCWKREERRGESPLGELVMPMDVSAEGEGRSFGELVSDTVGNDKLVSCLQDKLGSNLFPAGLGSVEIELTLTLREDR